MCQEAYQATPLSETEAYTLLPPLRYLCLHISRFVIGPSQEEVSHLRLDNQFDFLVRHAYDSYHIVASFLQGADQTTE